MYPRHRLDALADAIFGVAMTLLVLDIRLPESADPHTSAELLTYLYALTPKFWPYVLSFLVVGFRWRALVRGRSADHQVSHRYASLMIVYLLLVTLMPFSTILIGRFASLPPALWIYSGNLAAMAVISWFLGREAPAQERASNEEALGDVIVFVASAALVIGLTFVNPNKAAFGFLLNLASPAIDRFLAARRARTAPLS